MSGRHRRDRYAVCARCFDPLVWHDGNGGQWLGANPPRDWMTCHGSVSGPQHEPLTRERVKNLTRYNA